MTLLVNGVMCVSDSNGTLSDNSYHEVIQELLPAWISALEYMPRIWAMFGSLLVGLSGVLPLLLIPIDQSDDLKQGG